MKKIFIFADIKYDLKIIMQKLGLCDEDSKVASIFFERVVRRARNGGIGVTGSLKAVCFFLIESKFG